MNISKKNPDTANLWKDLFGLTFLFLALYSLLALLSFSSSDPSLFTSSKAIAKNLGGIIGSHWASILLQIFGASAFMLTTIFLLAGIAFFRKITGKEWVFAAISFILVLIFSSACFGFLKSPLGLGGARLPMGGLIGTWLSDFLRAYLNTVGALLLTVTLLVFSVSLSTKISVKNLGLYAWLGISKAGIFIVGGLLYIGMQISQALASLSAQLKPKLIEMAKSTKAQLVETFRREKKESSVVSEKTPVLFEPVVGNGPSIMEPPVRLQPPTDSDDPEILLEEDSHDPATQAIFNNPGEMETSIGTKSNFSPILNFMKKNEKSVKSALGHKIKYELPPLSFLHTPIAENTKMDRDELLKNSKMLEEKFTDFNVKGQVTAVKPGPVVTMYEFKPAAGVKVNSISNLADDLALALSATSIRIVAPIPGRDVVGIEVPNKNRESVLMKEIIGADSFKSKNHSIPVTIGKDILGAPVVADLIKMPHLLVAGTTGSGKSVFINSLIISLLYKFTPHDLSLILVDPKQLELAPYNDIPHLLLPVVTEPRKASLALNWAVQEMERRYKVIAASVTRDQESYNKKLDEMGAEKMLSLLNKGKNDLDEKLGAERMPKLVIIIDELADLMMTAKADVENNICRLAQKARAAGIHLVLATQRPSTDVVTGLIKANLPSRICFKVSSKIDSRVMFDAMGAEKLIGMGDMLFMPPGDSRLVRMHGAYISIEEVDQITSFWRAQGKPNYREDILLDPEEEGEAGAISADDMNDPVYQQALDIAHSAGSISASYLQRRLRIGYNKAARFVEMMEAQGIVGPAEGSKPRPILGNHSRSV